MDNCTFCAKQANKQENTAPYRRFCDTKCQYIHYALIQAGGKRGRDDEIEEEQDGVDFTRLLPDEVLELILSKVPSLVDLFSLAEANWKVRFIISSDRFQNIFLKAGRHNMQQVVEYGAQLYQLKNEHLHKWKHTIIIKMLDKGNKIYYGKDPPKIK